MPVTALGPIDAVVFDVGGVLLDWDPRHLYRKLFDDVTAMDRFLAEVCTLEWHARHDLGHSVHDSCEELAGIYPEQADLIMAWASRGEEMVAGPIEGTVEILGELRAAGVRCYALTNMERETFPKRLARFPFMGWFDGAVVSGFEGVAKPDRRIFETLLARFDLHPSTTLFVDDTEANVQAAQRAGMRALRFRSPDQLRGELRRLGILCTG